MLTNRLPYGGEAIASLRKKGKRPADMVLISLIGPLHGEDNPVVVARLGCRYAWNFLAGLECLVVANSRQPKIEIREILDALKVLPVPYLGLWLADRQNGLNCIVDGVPANPHGLLRYMTSESLQNFAGIGQQQEDSQCA